MFRSKTMTTSARVGAAALATLAAILLAACGAKKDISSAAADPAGAEVIAKVNGDELTAGQLTLALQKQRGIRADAADAMSKQILDQLIDEQIIAQKAVSAKLDKDPKVIQQLESARRDILARRFIEEAAETAGKPPSDQVQKFYDSRPAMFAQRKIYTLQRLDIQAPDDRRAEIDAHVRSLKSANELTDWLKAQNLHYNVKTEQDASEQLPPTVLEKIATMKDGESTVVPSQYGMSALTLVSSASAPKTLADARPAIEQYLSTQSRREIIVNLQKTVRDGAKIDYLGKFAGSASPPPDAAGPAVASSPVTSAATAASGAASSASQNNPAQK
jgi:EpsD family peptidyl-prolyl cis-trans isomerase